MRSLPAMILVAAFLCNAALGAETAARPAMTTIKSIKVTQAATSAKVTWQADEGKGIKGWAVQWGSFSALEGRTAYRTKHLKPGSREATISDLRPGRVYAVNLYPYFLQSTRASRAPVSGQPGVLKVRVGERGTGRPAAPRNLRAVTDGTRVRVTWSPSRELNVAGYEVARKAPGEDEAKPYLKLTISGTTPVLARIDGARARATGVAEVLDVGLEENQEYEYSVRAFTEDEPPEYSDPAGPITIKTEPYVFRPSDMVFVINTEAKNARKIALNYCQARGIKNPQAVQVKLKATLDISRGDYEKRLLAPVRRYLEQNPRTTILVLVRGIPLRLPESGRSTDPRRYYGWDRASVDSELALARAGDYSTEGRLRNPLFGKTVRLTPVERILGVGRLDGPDDRIANDLVRRAVSAEKFGVQGIAFFDARGLTSGGYAMGDQMILRAADIMKKDGRLSVKIDQRPDVVDLSVMKETIGFYYGWYSGRFTPKNKRFRFGRGAVATHLHSYAGWSVSAKSRWTGPMLAHGATAVLGTCDEPLLDGFPAPDPLVGNLLKGRNLAEAALASTRFLSWVAYCVGDPLYRPFKPKEPDRGPAAK